MKPLRLSIHSFTTACLLTLSLLFGGGAGGCGGGSGDGDDTSQAGLNIFSISRVPRFSGFLNPGILVENGPTPILKLQTEAGGPCPEFCYLRQGLIEAERQMKTIDLSLCVAQAAQESNAAFDIPTAGCRYFNLVTDDGGTPMRLCRDGNRVSVSTCADGSLDQQYLFVNDESARSVSATLIRRFDLGNGCEDRSKLDFSANCPPENFNDPDCSASIDASFCGCYGDGRVDYGVTGGDNPAIEVSSTFAAGGLGADAFGTFDSCGIGDWSLGQAGCFKSSAEGSFPAIPIAEVPVSEIEGCENLAAGADLCPNEAFDPDLFDPAYPICPFKEASGATCGFLFDDTGCCDVSGSTLSAESAVSVDPADVPEIFERVSAASCPGAVDCATLAFEDDWDCEPPTGEILTAVDATSLDLAECLTLLEDIENFQAEENCDEQTSNDGADFIASEYESLPDCANDNDCAAGEICHITDPDTPAGSCVTAPVACSPKGDDCQDGQVCAFDPALGNARCAPEGICASSCPTDQPCNTDTGDCEAVACSVSASGDCDKKLDRGYICTGTPSTVCQ